MAILLELPAEVEANLAARAEERGMDLAAFVKKVLEEQASGYVRAHPPMTGKEKAAAFRAWAESFPPGLPVLTLEQISRESMYEED
jgi:hypothetical protein